MWRTVMLTAAVLISAAALKTAWSSREDREPDDPGSDSWVGTQAPELSDGVWINSPPLRVSSLRGKVILLEFWTYGCYNCRNTIPKMNEWREKFAGQDLVMIGVHTPEFGREKDEANVRRNVSELKISYPVVTDNEYRTWDTYRQQYWPTVYLIDRKGTVRYVHIGEGSYDRTERTIATLLAEEK